MKSLEGVLNLQFSIFAFVAACEGNKSGLLVQHSFKKQLET